MAALKYRDEHNKVGFLEKPKGSTDYHQVLDFLRGSHIRYAITNEPIIYDSLIKQFWSTASLRASAEGPPAILATIDRTPYTITESLVRSQLQLDDEGGVEDLPIADIYLGSWDQFGSQVAIALICLTEGRRPTTTISSAPMNEQGPSSDPNIASSSRLHESAPDLFTSTNVEDETQWGSFIPHLLAVPTGGSHEADIPPSSSIPSDEFAGGLCSYWIATLKDEREEMQRKRQQDVLNSAKYYTDSDWNDIMSQVYANQGLIADLLGPDVNAIVRTRGISLWTFLCHNRRGLLRTFVKNQSSTIYTTGWTMKHVKSFSDDQLKTEFDKIRAAVAELKSPNIKRSLKRPGADLEQPSSKKSKPIEALQSSVPDESQQPSVEVPSQKATKEDVEVPSSTASTAQHTDGDPEAEHKLCIKYASNADSASDDDTPVNLHAVFGNPFSLGYRNRLDDILWPLMTFYAGQKAAGVGSCSFGEILMVFYSSPEVECVGNELTTAVQLIAFLKKQISDSRRPKVHDCSRLDADCLVAGSTHMKVAFGVSFKMLLFNPLSKVIPTGRYIVPTGKDNVIVSAGKTKVIPAGSTILVLRILNINFLHVFGCPVYIHNHKDHLGKFDEKADDGYLLGYSLVSKAFRVFNTRRQQTEETYHIIFDESPNAIKFLKPSINNINIAENERYPPDEYLHPYEPS
ncbi:hypothetical protein Tco_0161748 [Tanacetum coccineum]